MMIAKTEAGKGRTEEAIGPLTESGALREPATTVPAEVDFEQTARTLTRHRRVEVTRPPPETPSQEKERKVSYRCPVCGNGLPHLAALPPFDAPCCECGSHLWCRRRDSAEGVVLEALPGRAPEPREVEEVADSLGRRRTLDRVTVDLSKLETINSSYLAALVGMKKRLQTYECTLFLCGLRPIVREIFKRIRFDRLFDIV